MVTILYIICAFYLIGCIAALGYWLHVWFKHSMKVESYADILMFFVTFFGSWITLRILIQTVKEH